MMLVNQHAGKGTIQATCDALGVSRATYYRRRKPARDPSKRKPHPRRLSEQERQQILDTLCSREFADLSPYQVYAILLERGTYLGSIRTMYRVLKEKQATKDRRGQRTHPTHPKPQLVATAPNQVWSWDISKIAGPRPGMYYSLYVVLDLFSRYVVSWLLAQQESAHLAKRLIRHGTRSQGIGPHQLTIHADRGAPMTSTSLYGLFDTLGILGSHSRPRVSNDNAYSEAQFKTLKYHRTYPKRFESLHAAESYFQEFFHWYNHEHHHVGIGLFTPAQVHSGIYQRIQTVRQQALDEAYEAHPERFVAGKPLAPQVPTEVAINPEPFDLKAPSSLSKEPMPRAGVAASHL